METLPINWCRISSINSMLVLWKKIVVFSDSHQITDLFLKISHGFTPPVGQQRFRFGFLIMYSTNPDDLLSEVSKSKNIITKNLTCT